MKEGAKKIYYSKLTGRDSAVKELTARVSGLKPKKRSHKINITERMKGL
jgi:hypothetical protein